MPTRPPITVARATGAVLLLAVGLWASSGTAAASCGDYVKIVGQSATHDSEPASHTPTSDSPGKPCHGPGCSAAPTPAPAPLTTPPKVEPTSKEVAVRTTADAPVLSASRSLAFLDADGRPVSRPSAPFHPPRPF